MELQEIYDEFVNSKKAQGRSPNTLKEYATVLLDFFEWLDGGSLSPAALDGFMVALREGWQPATRDERWHRERSDATIRKYARTLRTFVIFATERGHMEGFKVRIPELREERDKFALTLEQVDTIGKYLNVRQVKKGKRINHLFHRDELAFWLVLETGCRIGEALALTWADVDLERGTVFIMAAKTRYNRHAAINTLWHKASELLELEPHQNGPVIRTRDGEPMKYQGYRKFIDRLNGKVDLGTRQNSRGEVEPVRFTAHDLRRTFITLALQQGIPVPVVAAQVGHTDWKTTQGYDRTDVAQRVDISRSITATGPKPNISKRAVNF